MSAAEALRAARAAGVMVMPDGESLVLEAKDEPSKAVLDALSRHKLAILALLRSGQDVWTAEDWRARFEERAGFLEHDGGLSRVDAEVHAFEHCIFEWLNANPSASPRRMLHMVRQGRKAERDGAAVRSRRTPRMASRRVLARLASIETGGSRSSAEENGHRRMGIAVERK